MRGVAVAERKELERGATRRPCDTGAKGCTSLSRSDNQSIMRGDIHSNQRIQWQLPISAKQRGTSKNDHMTLPGSRRIHDNPNKKWHHRVIVSLLLTPRFPAFSTSSIVQCLIIAMMPGFLALRCCILIAGPISKKGFSIISLFNRSVISSNILWYARQ